MSNSLVLDQVQRFVGSDLNPNCFKRFSVGSLVVLIANTLVRIWVAQTNLSLNCCDVAVADPEGVQANPLHAPRY